jgi:hypothetical protein
MNPPQKPQLRLDVSPWTVSLGRPTGPLSDSATPQQSSPPESSTRSLLSYTVGMLPDDVLSPSSWRTQALTTNKATSPLTVRYLVPETSVMLHVTGYANDQYVVRLTNQQTSHTNIENRPPLITVSIGGDCYDGQSKDVPAWKVRETLLERIKWNQLLD